MAGIGGLFSELKIFFSRINNKIFYKIYLMFIIFIIIPVVGIALLSIRHSTDNIVKQVEKSALKNLTDRKSMINQEIKVIDNMAKSIVSNKNIQTLLETMEIQFKEQVVINDIISTLNDLIYTNEIIDSIYIYDPTREYVISDTKYSLNNFNDPMIFDLEFNKGYKIIRRELPTGYTLSYIWGFNDIIRQQQLNIIININYNKFFNLHSEEPDFGTPSIFIFNDEYQEIFLSSKYVGLIDKSIIDDIVTSEKDSSIFEINHENHMVFKIRSDILDWNIVYLYSYFEITQEEQLLKKLIMSSLFAVLIVSFFLAYIFSLYLYKPLDRLVKKIENTLDNESYPEEYKNEYSIIDSAINHMIINNSELMLKYKQALPYLEQYSVLNMLMSKTFDYKQFVKILEAIGVRFEYSRYLNVIIDFETIDFSEKARAIIDSFFADYINKIKYLLLKIDNERISIIINTDLDEDRIISIISEIKERFNSNDIDLTIFIGETYNSIEKVYSYFHDLIRQTGVKFFEGKNKIIITNSICINTKEFVYDKAVDEQIITMVKSLDYQGAVDTLNNMINRIIDNNNCIEYIKYAYFMVVSSIIYVLNYIGIQTENFGMKRTEIFDIIQKSPTNSLLKLFVEDIISKSISLIESNKEEKHKQIINKILDYINSNYGDSSINLDEIADMVNLSPRYVNSIFKIEMGSTIYEYITKLRMDAAAKLLVTTDFKVKKIVDEVGYNSTQSFLRLFKKVHNMTPIEYKREHGKNKDLKP